jgi:hypothetical protein
MSGVGTRIIWLEGSLGLADIAELIKFDISIDVCDRPSL